MLYRENINKIVKLLEEHCFIIKKVDYKEEHFGNFIVIFSRNNEMNFRLIEDKASTWCEIRYNDEWHFVEDIFKLIGINIDNYFTKYDDLEHMIKVIELNYSRIAKLFKNDNIDATELKLKTIADKRIHTIFKKGVKK